MIIKNILINKIYIHPITYIFIIIFLLIGKIYNILIFTSIIFIHELGHTIIAKLFKFKIDKIYIYPYGGISKYNYLLNTPNYKEFLVLIFGFIFQLIYLFIGLKIYDKYLDLFIFYNYFIIIFNLIPIYPLDGGKLLNIFLSYFISFKKSYFITYFISFILIGILISLSIINKSLIMLLIIIFLFIKIFDNYKELNYIFNKFILERYLYKFKFNKTIIVKDIDSFKKSKKHIIGFINEEDYLKKIIDKRKDL